MMEGPFQTGKRTLSWESFFLLLKRLDEYWLGVGNLQSGGGGKADLELLT